MMTTTKPERIHMFTVGFQTADASEPRTLYAEDSYGTHRTLTRAQLAADDGAVMVIARLDTPDALLALHTLRANGIRWVDPID